ncbi:MAG: hypothetical protein ACW99E_15775 [Promethearchaeota archaeon]
MRLIEPHSKLLSYGPPMSYIKIILLATLLGDCSPIDIMRSRFSNLF